jgi:hypothetical protein
MVQSRVGWSRAWAQVCRRMPGHSLGESWLQASHARSCWSGRRLGDWTGIGSSLRANGVSVVIAVISMGSRVPTYASTPPVLRVLRA